MKKVETGDTIKVHYTGKLHDGSVFDSSLNEGREPLEVVLGETPLIPGFVDGFPEFACGFVRCPGSSSSGLRCSFRPTKAGFRLSSHNLSIFYYR